MDSLNKCEGQQLARDVKPTKRVCAAVPGECFMLLKDSLSSRFNRLAGGGFQLGYSSRQLATQSALAGRLRTAGGAAALHCSDRVFTGPGTPCRALLRPCWRVCHPPQFNNAAYLIA